MSDVREQLAENLAITHAAIHMRRYEVADAILERFDVTPKPVVTEAPMGALAVAATNWPSSLDLSCLAAKEQSYARVGKELNQQLESSGLRIVRVDE